VWIDKLQRDDGTGNRHDVVLESSGIAVMSQYRSSQTE
jgi:hypothetical protein